MGQYLAVSFKDGKIGELAILSPKTLTMPQLEASLMEKGVTLRWIDISDKTPEEIAEISLTDVLLGEGGI